MVVTSSEEPLRLNYQQNKTLEILLIFFFVTIALGYSAKLLAGFLVLYLPSTCQNINEKRQGRKTTAS